MKHWLTYVGVAPLLLTLAWPITVFFLARVRAARQRAVPKPITRRVLILHEVEFLDISGQRVRLPRRTVLTCSPHLYWIFGIASTQNFTFSDATIQAAVQINSALLFENDQQLLEGIALSAHKETSLVWMLGTPKPPVKSAMERLLDDESGVK